MGKIHKVTPEMIKVRTEWLTSWEKAWVGIYEPGKRVEGSIAAVLACIANDPPVPTEAQVKILGRQWSATEQPYALTEYGMREWLRICFLKPEPEVPEEIRALFPTRGFDIEHEWMENQVVRAYELGKQAASK